MTLRLHPLGVRRDRILQFAALAATVTGLIWPTGASAQGAKGKKGIEPERIAGSVTEVEKKGKAATLMIDKDDGGKLEVLITPRLRFTVMGKGDASLIQPKSVLSSEKIVKSNNELFGHQFTLHMGNAPMYSIKQEPGGGDWYHVCGQVVSVTDKSMSLNFGAGFGTQKLSFEEGTPVEVTVSSNDPDLVVEGSKVELEGTTRGSKFLPSKVTVTREKPLTADELQAAGNDKRSSAKGKTAASAKAGKKSGKPKSDGADGDSTDSVSDPFGVLGQKDGKETGSKTSGKSPPEKKGTDKGTDK